MKFILRCSKCGEDVERDRFRVYCVCFNCKKKKERMRVHKKRVVPKRKKV